MNFSYEFLSVLEFIAKHKKEATEEPEESSDESDEEDLRGKFEKAKSLYDKGLKINCENDEVNAKVRQRKEEAMSTIDVFCFFP